MINLATNFSEQKLIEYYPFDTMDTPVLVDVGANVGSFSHTYAKQGWQIIAFEPVQALVERFKARNRDYLDQITLIENAVSDVTGDILPFFTSDEHPGIHSLKPFHETHQSKMQVTTTRLDDALDTHDVESVTLLKVDIEGADFLALKGFDFERWKPELVMIEFMDERSSKNFDYTHHDVAAYMDKMGYATIMSEWEPIVEYYKPGSPTSHRFIQIAPYPLDHEPAWGNMIFVTHGNEHKLMDAYEALKRDLRVTALKKFVKQIPGAKRLYRLIRR